VPQLCNVCPVTAACVAMQGAKFTPLLFARLFFFAFQNPRRSVLDLPICRLLTIPNVASGAAHVTGASTYTPHTYTHTGTHTHTHTHKMGEAAGTLLREEITEAVPAVLAYIAAGVTPADVPPQFASAYAAGGVRGWLDAVWNVTESAIPSRFIEEIDGMSAGSGVSVAELRRVSMLGEMLKMGCSMLGAWGPATVGGNLLQLRALDWDTDGPFQSYPVVLIRHPADGGHAFATVGYAGDVGAITGYSAADVGISEKVWLHDTGASSWSGMPTTFVLRQMLQFGTTLNDTIDVAQRASRTNSIFAGVGAKHDGQFRVLEYGHEKVTVWSDATGPDYANHTRRAGLLYIDKHSQPDPGQGSWCLDALLKSKYGKLDPLTVLTEVVPVYQTGDAQVAVYDFENRFMYVAYPSPAGTPAHPLNVTKAYDRPVTRFDLGTLFSHPAP
jgi:isopenicillin-N N-acyltransferase-like protein